jgi:hypothetical protein
VYNERQDMRHAISLLLVVLFASPGYAGPADCCDHAASHTQRSNCHQMPARPTPCNQAQISGCPDFVCEAEHSNVVVPASARPWFQDDARALPAGGTTAWVVNESQLSIPHAVKLVQKPEKLFLRYHVLLI